MSQSEISLSDKLSDNDVQAIDQLRGSYDQLVDELGRVIVGQRATIERLAICLFARGHALLMGVPGLAKTLLVSKLSETMSLDFSRIQFTPDLMPADVIGTNIMTADEKGSYRFEFREGPIFTQLLLADEINRATPKTQSALLETMQEGTVTTGGNTYHLKQPFFVLATQNPIEQEGTFPLPEAQLDRFMFKVVVPFLSREELNEVVSRTILRKAVEVNKVVDGPRILHLRTVLDRVVVSDPMRDYACRLVLATHPDTEFAPERVQQFLRWGASPRAAQALIRAARVRALSQGRSHVAFEDIGHFAAEVLQHRALLNYDGQAENVAVADLISECVKSVATKV